MFMNKVGLKVTGNPGLSMVAVIIITLILISGVYFKGLSQSFDEGSFLPDIDMTKADSEVGEDFAREYSITILVKGKNGNILTPGALAEILKLEKDLANSELLGDKFENNKDLSRNFNSIADQILFIAMLQNSLDGLLNGIPMVNNTLGFMDMGFQGLSQFTGAVNTSDNNATLDFLKDTRGSLDENLTGLGEPSQGIMSGGPGGSGGVPQDGLTAANMYFDQGIAMLESMTQDQLTELITNALTYDGSTSAAIRAMEPGLSQNLQGIISTITGLQTTFATLASNPNLANTGLYNATVGNSTEALDILGDINQKTAGLVNTLYGLSAFDLSAATFQIDSTFGFLGFGLGYMLTSDFDPAGGTLEAKGTLVLVYFNATLNEGEAGGFGGGDVITLEIEKEVDKIARNSPEEHAEYKTIGGGLITEAIMDANDESLMILMALSIVFVIIILFVIYRSFFDMGVSLLALGFGILWMYGAGAWLGFTFNPMTTMVPVLIVGLGIDYSIHVLMRYKEEQIDGKVIKEAMTIAITWVGTALLLATITTMVAFLSNLSSPMQLLIEFGILAAIGIFGCFISMILFLPAAKQLRDRRMERKGKLIYQLKDAKSKQACKEKDFQNNIFCRGIAGGATMAARAPGAVIAITVIITLASFYGAYNLETKFDFEDFLPSGLEITDDLNYMLNEFSVGSIISEETVIVLVKGDIADPSVIEDMSETISNMEDDTYVNKRSILPGANGNGLNGNITPGQQVPDVESIMSLMQDYSMGTSFNETFSGRYFSTFDENGQLRPGATKADIEDLIDWLYINAEKDAKFLIHYNVDADKYDSAVLRVSITVKNDEKRSFDTLDELNSDIKPLEANSNVDQAIVTGGPILFNTIMTILNESQLRSLAITIIACGIILTLVFWFEKRSVTLGVITTLPVVLVISWSLGTMYVVGIPLNIMTITIASLTVGLGVTYGIHITHRFLENLDKFPTIDEAGHNTVISTGVALFGAAATTIAAFGMLMFALLPPIQQFGGISAITIFYSFLSSVFILPTFLRIWAKYRLNRGTLTASQNKEK